MLLKNNIFFRRKGRRVCKSQTQLFYVSGRIAPTLALRLCFRYDGTLLSVKVNRLSAVHGDRWIVLCTPLSTFIGQTSNVTCPICIASGAKIAIAIAFHGTDWFRTQILQAKGASARP